MATAFIEGTDALPPADLTTWDRLHREFEGDPDEHRAAQVLCRLTGGSPELWDRDGRHNAVDILLTLPGGTLAAVEVSSTFDRILRRDMHNSDRFAADIVSRYRGADHWVLHLHPGWDVPAARQRRTLAAAVAKELEQREPDGAYGNLASANWVFAWRDDTQPAGVEIRGWDSRVPPTSMSASAELSLFLDGEAMRGKRKKLVTGALSTGARYKYLYILTTPTGGNAHIGTATIWEFSDGTFSLPTDIDELWLDGLNGTVRRFVQAQELWTEYSV